MATINQVKPDHIKIKLKKGLDLKISGSPGQVISRATLKVTRVALLGEDYPGMKPSLLVKEGSKVKLGQVLFTDKKNPKVKYTSPGTGKVIEINRGEKRKFLSIVIELSGTGENTFKKFTAVTLKNAKRIDIVKNLLDSGLWTAIKARPYGYVADPDEIPHSIFINAMDTHPHAPDPSLFIEKFKNEFSLGVQVLASLTEGKTYVVSYEGREVPETSGTVRVEVKGPHPAGNTGTHIHFLDPVSEKKTVWSVSYQDVAAIGYLFKTGKILTQRMAALTGPACKEPAIYMTRFGASINEIAKDKNSIDNIRVISGSLLNGHIASGPMAYLGRFHHQVSFIEEGNKREFLGWLKLGLKSFSMKRIYLSSLMKPKTYEFNTNLNGSKRAIIPIGSYESVMPMDINPTFLLRSLMSNDIESSINLGILELVEEDMTLLTFVSPGKEDFGIVLRGLLERIAKGE